MLYSDKGGPLNAWGETIFVTRLTRIELKSERLDALPDSVAVPHYDRGALKPSIVHIGVGGFHRAHFATYIDDLCRAGHTDWGIVGAGVMPGDGAMAEALGSQDHLYTLISRSAETADVRVIGSIIDYVHAHPDTEPLVVAIADARTEIVSLTVTEGGYPVDDMTGEYSASSSNAGDGTAFATLATGLARRRLADNGRVTIMSCDNVIHNGDVTRVATIGEAQRIGGQDLVTWIETNVTFPNGMVDRITPATADSDREWLADNYGLMDRWPVATEPFRQWVLEDDFAGARLPLEELDVIVTDNVEPYEHMKLRLLNAGHSCLTYLAALEGHVRVDEAMADPALCDLVEHLLRRESKPNIPNVPGIDLDSYIDSLIERFSNPRIGDQIARLCLDGTVKFPKFLVPTLEAQLANGGPIGLSALSLAGWCDYLNGVDHHGRTIHLANDPGRQRAEDLAHQSQTDPAAFAGFTEVLGPIVSTSDRFRNTFVAALSRLRDDGVQRAITAAINGELESRG